MFKHDEVKTLKVILNNCQQLESIKVWCSHDYLNENELLEVITKYSPKKFYKIKIFWMNSRFVRSEFFLKELEPVFISWANRKPQKSLSLIIIDPLDEIEVKKESMEIIEKFQKLGVIKKFEIVKVVKDDF